MAESLFYANRAFSDCSSVDFLLYRQLRVFAFAAVSSTTSKQPKLPKLYILLLTSIWGKFTGKIRKRLLLGSLLTGVLSYIALGAHYGALVNSLGMSLLIGAFVYWLRREG